MLKRGAIFPNSDTFAFPGVSPLEKDEVRNYLRYNNDTQAIVAVKIWKSPARLVLLRVSPPLQPPFAAYTKHYSCATGSKYFSYSLAQT